MRFLERLYRSPLGRLMSFLAAVAARLQRPFMVYGIRDPASHIFRKFSRYSSTVTIMSRERLAIGDNVWVWHHSILDATEGLEIGEGTQIGAWVGIFTHGSEHAIRLLGPRFVHIPNQERRGYTRGKVVIGAYTFVGAGSVILPGVSVGKGCLIGAGSLVTRSVPDFSVVTGSPATVRGSTLDIDRRVLEKFDFADTYFDPSLLPRLRNGESGSKQGTQAG